jgi:ankyrin repeat protein
MEQMLSNPVCAAKVDLNAIGKTKTTPLQQAVTSGREETISILLKYGANPLLRNSTGQDPYTMLEGC